MPTQRCAPPPYQTYGADDPGALGGLALCGDPYPGEGDPTRAGDPTRGAELAGMSLCGDPYGDRDDVTRGVSMADPPSGALGLAGTGVDFYGGKFDFSDDLLSAYPMPPHYNGFGGKEFGGFFDHGPGFPEPLGKAPPLTVFPHPVCEPAAATSPTKRFEEFSEPPSVPDPLYCLDQSTTLFVDTGPDRAASQIGDALLDFLEGCVDASVLKVNYTKFAIKAKVFADGLTCTVKAKVFHQTCSTYAIEFQRRAGDALTFARARQQAAKYLSEEKGFIFAAGTEASRVDVPTLAAPPVEHAGPSTADGRALGLRAGAGELLGCAQRPLLDMAGLQQLPSLQVEAVASLLTMASDLASATSLCSDDAFRMIRQLFQKSEEEIVYPMSQVLLHLTKCQSAKPWLSDEHLLLSVVRVVSKASCLMVKKELAKVVEAVVQCCSDLMNASTKEQLAKELLKVEGETAGVEAQASQHLASARRLISY